MDNKLEIFAKTVKNFDSLSKSQIIDYLGYFLIKIEGKEYFSSNDIVKYTV